MFYILYSALPTSFLFHPVCVWWVDAVWMPNSLSATHSLTLHPHEGRGENEIKKLMSFLASYCQGQTRFDLGSSHMFERNLCSSAWSTTSQISSFTLVLPLSFFSSFFLVLLLLHYLILFASFFYCFPEVTTSSPVGSAVSRGGWRCLTWSTCVQHGSAPGPTAILLHPLHCLEFNFSSKTY